MNTGSPETLYPFVLAALSDDEAIRLSGNALRRWYADAYIGLGNEISSG